MPRSGVGSTELEESLGLHSSVYHCLAIKICARVQMSSNLVGCLDGSQIA